MLVLFTDSGALGPPVDRLKAVLARAAPAVPVLDLLHDAPSMNPRASAYLLAALSSALPAGAVLACVVEPAVGPDCRALALKADGRWFVGPDNGLLDIVALRSQAAEWWALQNQPAAAGERCAAVAAQLALGMPPPGARCESPAAARRWPADLPEIVYVDRFGNAATGLRAQIVGDDVVLRANDRCFFPVTTFGDAPAGTAIWYANQNGLTELAISSGSAAASCRLAIGTPVSIQEECA